MLAPAKKEGQVVLAGSPDESFRQTAAAAFQKSYGINLEYLPLAGAEVAARVQREAVAGKVSIDVMLGGSSALTTLLPQGLV
ncbi:MAG TPA: hypothetical protein VKU60_00940, partial [Chloroflexota bacterium]|nr:hypothetical protein [Chloroflexota bacterium]